MQAIEMRWLVTALVVSLLVVVFRRAVAWYAMRRDRFVTGISPKDSKARSDYADAYLVLGAGAAIVSVLLILLKLLL